MVGKKYQINLINNKKGHWIRISPVVRPRGYEAGLRESDIDLMQQWCTETGCGERMSFDMFRFKSKQELELFVLRWS